jgi:hypothetical protein
MNNELLKVLLQKGLAVPDDAPPLSSSTILGEGDHIALARFDHGVRYGWTEPELQHFAQCAQCQRLLVIFFRQQCPDVRLLIASDQSELNQVESRAVVAHVEEGCERCKAVLALLRSAWARLGKMARADALTLEWPSDAPELEWTGSLPRDVSAVLRENEAGILELHLRPKRELAGWRFQAVMIGGTDGVRTWDGQLAGLWSSGATLSLGPRASFLPPGSDSFTLAICLVPPQEDERECLDPVLLKQYAFTPSAMDRFESAHFQSCDRCKERLAHIQEESSPNPMQIVQFIRTRDNENEAISRWLERLGSAVVRQAVLDAALRLWDRITHSAISLAGAARELSGAALGLKAGAPAYMFATDVQYGTDLASAENGAMRVLLRLVDGEMHLSVSIADPESAVSSVTVEIARGYAVLQKTLDLECIGGKWLGATVFPVEDDWLDKTDPIVMTALPVLCRNQAFGKQQ